MIELLKNKTDKDRSLIKSHEIVKIKSIPKTQRTDYYIEILDIKSHTTLLGIGGIEVYIKAWDKNNQPIGFGKDGSVEIERFRVINSPILVDDPMGTIVRTWTNERTGELKTRILKEDLKEALLQSLAHTIKVKKQKFDGSKIIAGKIGNTTTTVYPDAGDPGSTTVDGSVRRELVAGSGETWSNLVTGAGTGKQTLSTAGSTFTIQGDSTLDQWIQCLRSIYLFDTSSIPDTETIDSAILSLRGTDKFDGLSITPTVNIYASTPASNTTLANADYGQTGSTAFATAITYANWSTTGYNDFTLNSSGLTNISATGVSKFSARNPTFDVANSPPTWANNYSEMLNNYADEAGTTSDPKLVVESSSATRKNLLLMGVGA